MYSKAGKFEGFNFIADDNYFNHFTGLMNFSDHAIMLCIIVHIKFNSSILYKLNP
jgi:hypothetical protein